MISVPHNPFASPITCTCTLMLPYSPKVLWDKIPTKTFKIGFLRLRFTDPGWLQYLECIFTKYSQSYSHKRYFACEIHGNIVPQKFPTTVYTVCQFYKVYTCCIQVMFALCSVFSNYILTNSSCTCIYTRTHFKVCAASQYKVTWSGPAKQIDTHSCMPYKLAQYLDMFY